MKKILLDTSIIIDFLRREDKQKTLLYKLSQEDIYVSIITHTELYAGKSVWEKEQAKEELEKIFSGIKILPLQEDISIQAGKIKARTNKSLLDCIIAASAIYHDIPLATINVKDFIKINNLTLFTE